MSSLIAEESRLAALDRYHILETDAEQEYDDLVELAAAICGTPMAMLTFVDIDSQWYKASVGIPRLRTDRDISFCTHTIEQPGLLVVPDMACDPRFAKNPFVAGNPYVRFYAGMPLRTAEGHALGTICVVDLEPRRLTPAQTSALEALSRQAMCLLELRLAAERTKRDLSDSAAIQKSLRESEAKLQVACRAGKITLFEDNFQTHRISWSQGQEPVSETGQSEGSDDWEKALDWIHPDDRARAVAARNYAIQTLTPLNLEMRILHPDGTVHWTLLQGEVVVDSEGCPLRITGSTTDITDRKKSEEALRSSEERLRNIVMGAPLVLFSLNADGIFTLSEGKGLEKLGLRPGEIVGRSIYEIYAEMPEVLEPLERAFGGEAFNTHLQMGELTFETWYSPVFGEDGHVTSVIGVACDVSERRQAEDALRSSEARFQAFMDNSPAFAYVKDHEGSYLYCNDAFDRTNEVEQGGCLGQTDLELWPGATGIRMHADTMQALTKDCLTETLTELKKPDGVTMYLQAFRFTYWDAQKRHFLGCLGLDVTEQKRAEKQSTDAQQKLEETLSQLNATLESTVDGLLVVDLQGQVLRANGMFYEMWHISDDMKQNRDDEKQIVHIMGQLADPEAFRTKVMQLMSHPEEHSFDVLIFKDGRIFERASRPLRIQDTFAGRVWSFRDVTAQEQTRQDLIRAKNHALASAQAKSEFLANMSHEIRTPMNGILGMTDLLLSTALVPQQKHYAATIKNSADSLLTVINDILDFSKIEAGKMTLETVPFSLIQVMQEVKDLLEPRALEKNLALFCSVPPYLPPYLSGDPARLRQILTNLVGNALKFTERGKVILEVSLLRETETHAEFRLSVRDTGIGIPKDRQEAIFDSFTQADGSITRRYGGTGLGLAICLRLTDLMAGRIGLESEPGQGSEFWLTVTLEKTNAIVEKPLANLWQTESEPLKLRVLLAEDNVINQEVASGFLEMWGCTVDVAGNGWLACRAVREKAYDVVLMDIQMPEMDGRQATADIRGRERGTDRHLPIIAMTAHNMQGDREQCLACGMDDYVSKPVDPEELLTALKRWGKPAPVSPAPALVLEQSAAAVEQLAPARPSMTSEVLPVPAEAFPVLDVERLHRSCAGKAKLERRIMTETLRLTPATLERLRAAVGTANAELTRFEAHTLKGSSRTLGAEALGNAAATMEDTAKTGILKDMSALLARTEAEWMALSAVLEDCLNRDPWKDAL